MAETPHTPRDRYDVTGNVEAEYVDAEQTIMVNKLSLFSLTELQLAEEESLAAAYETLLGEVRLDTPLTCDLLLHIHARIFGEIYAWAGQWRTVNISKPGITWPPAQFVPQSMADFERRVLLRFSSTKLQSDKQFCSAAAEIQGEFLVVHPFREGNARTIKLMTDLIASQTGRPLLVYDTTEAGKENYILAAGQAFKRNYRPLEELIQTALHAGQRQ